MDEENAVRKEVVRDVRCMEERRRMNMKEVKQEQGKRETECVKGRVMRKREAGKEARKGMKGAMKGRKEGRRAEGGINEGRRKRGKESVKWDEGTEGEG